jgi:orotidine-5'-phosphate decarboxylase
MTVVPKIEASAGAPDRGTRVTPIVALDMAEPRAAVAMVSVLGDLCRFYKVGAELFTAAGPSMVQSLTGLDCQVFLDLKYHDIPTTVHGACRSAARIGARIVTVHASGGRDMMRAAVEGAREGASQGRGAPCEVFAVTVLTSLDANQISSAWGRPSVDVREEVLRMAESARRAGVPGVVCSGSEAAAVRDQSGAALQVLVPGVRLPGAPQDDQRRIVTPAAAAAAGARYVVLGRTVTAAPVPREAMSRVLADLRAGGV